MRDPGLVDVVFDHWKAVMQSPRSKLDDKRRKAINGALKMGYELPEILKAIDGCSKSPHNMGFNDRQTKFNDIELILRNAANIDRFIGIATAPAAANFTGSTSGSRSPLNKQESLEERNLAVARRAAAKFHAENGAH